MIAGARACVCVIMLQYVCARGEAAAVAGGAVLLAQLVGGWCVCSVCCEGLAVVLAAAVAAACFPRARDRDKNREVTGITPPLTR